MKNWLNTISNWISNIFPENWLEEKLRNAEKENRPLVVKLWFDPTAPDLHLWHAVVLKKLKEFQDLDHKIVVIIGDFTASIWDPSWKNKTRPPLNQEEIKENAKTYLDQLYKILDPKRTEIRFNSEWLEKLTLMDTIQLLSSITVSWILQREDFSNRYNNNIPISMHELIYPLLQWYDSCEIEADIEIGGTDQIFNCLLWRELQKYKNIVQQIVIAMPILRWTDGYKKMSKSLWNYIALTDTPNDMYWKVMSLPDTLLEEYINLATDFSDDEKKSLINQLNNWSYKMEIKKIIAQNIVVSYYNKIEGENAKKYFEQQFQNKKFEDKEFTDIIIAEIFSSIDNNKLVDIAFKLVPSQSKSQLRSLINWWWMMIDWKKIINPLEEITINKDMKIKIWKKNYFNLI